MPNAIHNMPAETSGLFRTTMQLRNKRIFGQIGLGKTEAHWAKQKECARAAMRDSGPRQRAATMRRVN
jgi:hypothetical protein